MSKSPAKSNPVLTTPNLSDEELISYDSLLKNDDLIAALYRVGTALAKTSEKIPDIHPLLRPDLFSCAILELVKLKHAQKISQSSENVETESLDKPLKKITE